jgi:hypothetical protein
MDNSDLGTLFVEHIHSFYNTALRKLGVSVAIVSADWFVHCV